MIHHQIRKSTQKQRRFDKFANPSPETIPGLWHKLTGVANLASAGEAIGAHLLRSRLLDGVPSWRLPEVLDSLTTKGEAI